MEKTYGLDQPHDRRPRGRQICVILAVSKVLTFRGSH
jgi:hypothetical protein